ncbi:MAG TPA: sulfate ABC transporter substrate-binding protein [Acetobacteraceae bacterium]
MLAAGTMALLPLRGRAAARVDILNVSYDPTRELYKKFNAAFARHWTDQEGGDIGIRMSHGGSGAQARSVIDGLNADVVTLALAYDIDAIAAAGRLARDWQARMPDGSTPYTSTIVFLVRKGNPKQIKDWSDLTRRGVQVITPNPKTSGGARWNFLAAYAWALNEGGDAKALAYARDLLKNVPVLDTGARGATITFTERGIGDVLLAWENEAFLSIAEAKPGTFEVVVPSLSILAEPPVAVVDQVVDRRGTRKLAEAYLQYLYTPDGQEICAQNFYRPRLQSVAQKYQHQFPMVKLSTIEQFGGWTQAQQRFFADGGIFDQIYRPGG